MMVVKDSMVLIHLAKVSVLRHSCSFFGDVSVPEKVWREVVERGKEGGYPDAEAVEEVFSENLFSVEEVNQKDYLERANEYNIQGGEAEAVALYWEREADLLATDDDNVRRKKGLLDLDLIGTPGILLEMSEASELGNNKLKDSVEKLRDIGWFSSAVLDKILLEAGVE